MKEWKFNWFVDHMPKPTKECPYYRNMLLVDQFLDMDKNRVQKIMNKGG